MPYVIVTEGHISSSAITHTVPDVREVGPETVIGAEEWDEIKDLIEEGMLGEDEFDKIWENTIKSPGSPDQLDVDGFLSFNVELDDLFVFDDEEDIVNEVDATIAMTQEENVVEETSNMFYGEDFPPGVIFLN